MISYADFITLLFAFFVVMYSVSSINEGKYRVISESMRATFGHQERTIAAEATTSVMPVEDVIAPGDAMIPLPAPQPAEPEVRSVQEVPERTNPLRPVEDSLRETLGDYLVDGKVDLRETSRGLELEFNSRLLFDSGSSVLDQAYRPALIDVASVLRGLGNAVDVEGFTDDQPIDTARFPSNWELSTARAVAVIRLLIDYGVAPERLAAVGYGPHRPVASNESPAGRARNRRVILVVRSGEPVPLDGREKQS